MFFSSATPFSAAPGFSAPPSGPPAPGPTGRADGGRRRAYDPRAMTEHSGGHGLPGTYLLHLANLAERWGLDERALFDGTGLTKEGLADPAFEVPLPVANAFAERVRRLTSEPGIGILLGLQTYTSAHGYLGFAVMSAMTLRQAIALTIEYSPIRTTALAFDLKVDGGRAFLLVYERADFGSTRDLV